MECSKTPKHARKVLVSQELCVGPISDAPRRVGDFSKHGLSIGRRSECQFDLADPVNGV
jgi:hypothetical protein